MCASWVSFPLPHALAGALVVPERASGGYNAFITLKSQEI
jgi:hypothetical protein